MTFICDPESDRIFEPLENGDCYQDPTENGICGYQMKIHTQYACIKDLGLDDGNNGLSGGSIFLIILFVGLALYFIGGWVFNGVRNAKWKEVTNLPQYSFWTKLHLYILAGCIVSYETVKAKIAGSKKYEQIDHGL